MAVTSSTVVVCELLISTLFHSDSCTTVDRVTSDQTSRSDRLRVEASMVVWNTGTAL
jgi:hypothetical protein